MKRLLAAAIGAALLMFVAPAAVVPATAKPEPVAPWMQCVAEMIEKVDDRRTDTNTVANAVWAICAKRTIDQVRSLLPPEVLKQPDIDQRIAAQIREQQKDTLTWVHNQVLRARDVSAAAQQNKFPRWIRCVGEQVATLDD